MSTNHYPLIPQEEIDTLFSRGRAEGILQEIDNGTPQSWLTKDTTTVTVPLTRITTLPGAPSQEDGTLSSDYDYTGHPIMINGTPHVITETGQPHTNFIQSNLRHFKNVGAILLAILILYQYIPVVIHLITPFILIYLVGYTLFDDIIEKNSIRSSVITITVAPVWGLYREDHRYVLENSPWDLPRFTALTKDIAIDGKLTRLNELTTIIQSAENRWRRSLHHPEDMN